MRFLDAMDADQEDALRAAGATGLEISEISRDGAWADGATASDALQDHRDRIYDKCRSGFRDALLRAGAPERQLRNAFDSNPERTQAMDAARAFMTVDTTFLLLLGPPGTGKTCAATWAMSLSGRDDEDSFPTNARAFTFKINARFVRAYDIVRAAGFDKASREERDAIETTALLVIDDMGAEYSDAKGFSLSFMDSIIDARYEAGLKTIITSNADMVEFKRTYGARIEDRIREAGTVVVCSGESRRKPVTPKPLMKPSKDQAWEEEL